MSNTPQPPPLSPESSGTATAPKKGLRWLWPVVAVLALLLVGAVALVVVAVAGFAGYSYYANQKASPVQEPATPQKMQADYLLWSQSRQKLADWNTGTEEVIRPVKKPGLWESWFRLPPDSIARKTLLQRLPSGYKVKGLELGDYEKTEEGWALAYHVTLISLEDQFLVPAKRYNTAAKSKTFLRYSPYLIFAADLPAGLSYAGGSARKIFAANQTLKQVWRLPLVAKVDGSWQVVDADPLPFERNPEFESRVLAETGGTGALLLRSGSDLGRADQTALLAASDLDARIASIEADSAAYRQNLMANLPSRGVDRGGGAGTGTPTKAGVGTLAGAGTGALIGGLAAGGDGAAIGAGAGAAAGLLGGFIVGRSDEKRAAERQNSLRNSALRQAESQAANYKAGLYKNLEEELRLKAEQHNLSLRNSFGELPLPLKNLD